MLWSKTYGYSSINSIQLLPDGGFLSCGNKSIARYSKDGTQTTSKTYSGNFASLRQMQDNNFILCGKNTVNGYDYGYLVKVNQNCDTLWSHTYGTAGANYFSSVKQTNDGGFAATGYLSNAGMWFVKTDRDGKIW
jgi:hypothetical protein